MKSEHCGLLGEYGMGADPKCLGSGDTLGSLISGAVYPCSASTAGSSLSIPAPLLDPMPARILVIFITCSLLESFVPGQTSLTRKDITLS